MHEGGLRWMYMPMFGRRVSSWWGGGGGGGGGLAESGLKLKRSEV